MEMSNFKRTIIVLTTVVAAVIELIDTTCVNVALSQISGNLGATIEDVSWVVVSYAIANVIIIPMTGFLAQYFGRKNYYLASIAIFTIASYLCGASGSLGVLIFWRFIQGIGGGGLLSTSQSILFDAFPPNKRGVASGLFGLGIVTGPAVGPIMAGYIVDNYHWPLIFDINIPFGIIAILLTLKFVDRKPEEYNIDRKNMSIDYIGILCLIVGIGSLQYVLEKGQEKDWFEDKSIIVLTVTTVIGLISFVWWELTVKTPFINLKVLKTRNLIGSNVLSFVGGFGLFCSIFILPLMLQRTMGYTPTLTGLALLPGALAGMVCMPLIGMSLSKGVKPIYYIFVGFVLFILHGYLSSLGTEDSSLSFFIIPQILRGVATACLLVPIINQAVVGLAPKDIPHGISLTNMLRQLGGAFGIAVANTYVTTQYAKHRNSLVTNLQTNNDLLADRLNKSPGNSIELSLKILDMAVTKQAYLQSYLDGFLLISLFFICALPFIFLLKSKKMDKATISKVAEHSH